MIFLHKEEWPISITRVDALPARPNYFFLSSGSPFHTFVFRFAASMSSDEEKPPAPPVRLTSNRGTDLINSSVTVDRPLPKEPEDAERKKKVLKYKKGNKLSTSYTLDKPNISYPTNFEHTVHVGFDPASGEFTVSESFLHLCGGNFSIMRIGACFVLLD